MDYQNRPGARRGGGGVADSNLENLHRRERLKQLALQTINIDKDPYIFKNHVGTFECRLCLTVHPTDSSYLSHTQGKKHQTNLARRQALDLKEQKKSHHPLTGANAVHPSKSSIPVKKSLKIGRPGYKITKIKDPVTHQLGLLFQVKYPQIASDVVPRYRFMSAYEQKTDPNPDTKYQYLLMAADPYETCAFKIEAKEIDHSPGKFWTYYDKDSKHFFMQFFFRNPQPPRGPRMA